MHGDCDAIAQDLARESPRCRATLGTVLGASRLLAGEHLPFGQKNGQTPVQDAFFLLF